MINHPLISIITVVYNGSKTLEQTIQSVINQTYNYIEYIVIDGGSTDGTLDIIKKYENDISYWISEPDNGLYHAMNKGIEKSKGELIGMINSDDWYETNALALIVDAYQKYPKKRIFHGDRYDIKDNGTKIIRKFNPSSFKFLYYGMTYNHPSMFVHRELYKKNLYNTNLIALSDYEFVLRQFIKNKSLFYYIPIPYVNYRLQGISASNTLLSGLKQGVIVRKNVKMNIFEIILGFATGFLVFTLSKLIFKFKK